MSESASFALGAALTQKNLRDFAPASWKVSKSPGILDLALPNLAGRRGSPSETYILIGHVPVGPLPVGHHLPHDDTIAPHIAGRGELPVLDGFWGCPANGDLPTLWNRMRRVDGWEADQSGLCFQCASPYALCCTNCMKYLILQTHHAASDLQAFAHAVPLHLVPFHTLPSRNLLLIL